MELFHASAVVLDGRAVALTAPSGTGKTSVAAHLVAGGASFLTDDVLALEHDSGQLLAEPGPARIALTTAEQASLSVSGRARLGAVVGRSDKPLLEPAALAQRSPLAALYFLERSPAHEAIRIRRPGADTAPKLLASSFLPYLSDRRRLLNRLEICAYIAREVPVHAVLVPAGARASNVAAAIAEHVA
jgi:hypothetical protein